MLLWLTKLSTIKYININIYLWSGVATVHLSAHHRSQNLYWIIIWQYDVSSYQPVICPLIQWWMSSNSLALGRINSTRIWSNAMLNWFIEQYIFSHLVQVLYPPISHPRSPIAAKPGVPSCSNLNVPGNDHCCKENPVSSIGTENQSFLPRSERSDEITDNTQSTNPCSPK